MDWAAVEEVLRKGELRRQPDGSYVHVKVSARELGRRYGVSHTLVLRFARTHGIDLTAVRAGRAPVASKQAAVRGRGRPAGGAGVDWDAVEQRLLAGDMHRGANGREVYVIPSLDDLADELGVDVSLVRSVVRERRIRERRAEALAAVPVRVPAEEVPALLRGEIQAGPYPERVTRIANIYAAQFEQDLLSGEVRRGEASVLERLIRTDMQVQEAKRPAQEDLLEVVIRQLQMRLPAMRTALVEYEANDELSGLVIDVASQEVAPVTDPGVGHEVSVPAVPAGGDA